MASINILDENKEFITEIEEEILMISADAKAGKNVSPEFTDVDTSISWLATEVKRI